MLFFQAICWQLYFGNRLKMTTFYAIKLQLREKISEIGYQFCYSWKTRLILTTKESK